MESQNEFLPYWNPYFPFIREGLESSLPTQLLSAANSIVGPISSFQNSFLST